MKIKQAQKNIPYGWPQKKLGDVCQINMGQSPSSIAYNEIGNGLPLIQGNNDMKRGITVERIWTSETTKVAEKGSIILTVRAPVGVVGVAHNKICIGRGVCSINSANRGFIFHFLKYYESKWLSLEQGSTFTAVNSSDIRSLKLDLPPLPEQNRIVLVLETWDKAIEKLAKKIEVKKNIKKGLMQRLLTGELRLPGFSEAWQVVKLGEVGEIVTGNTPPMKELENYNGSYCWATAEDFNSKYIFNTAVKLTEQGKSKSRFLPAGSILVTCIASIGKNALAGVPLATNQQINAVVVNDKNDKEFIYYLIENSKKLLINSAGAGAMPILNKSEFSRLKIKIPKIKKEQTTISNILVTADKEIESLEQKLKVLKEQKKYLLNNLITGAIRTPETMKINA